MDMFLATPQYGTKRKQKTEETETWPLKKAREEPHCGKRPIVRMILQWVNQERWVKVLLITGCSVLLISKRLVHSQNIPRKQREKPAPLQNCSGEEVQGSGEEVTNTLTLQHRRHFSRETFEVTPMEAEVDIFLPF